MDTELLLVSARLREVLAYWDDKRGGATMPHRSHVDPAELRRHLPYLMLTDVLDEAAGPRFRFRLIGTEICLAAGRDSTGKYWDETVPPEAYAEVTASLQRVVAERRPLRVHGRLWQPGRDWRRFESIDLPLGDDAGRVTKILTAAAYD